MLVMAEKKKSKRVGRPQKHAGEVNQSGRTGQPLSLRLDPDLLAKMPQFIATFRSRHDVKLSKTDVVELALTRLYREYGILPPATEG